MSFLEELHKPDILDCISHLSSDEVFTPPKLVNEILDTLPQELFKNPDTKFLDPCCKSGVFLREIAKRLIDGLADKIPNLEARLDHIFKNQLFGLAITELTGLLSRRSVYCSKNANGQFSICEFANEQGNIEYKRTYHIWFKDKCMMCGASKSEYDRGEELETHAYSFIHTDEQRNSDLFKRLKEMKFDVIIGNPPYQLDVGVTKDKYALPIYQNFVQQAIKLNPRYITMIIPARWYTGGRHLDDFRSNMLNSGHISSIVDYPNPYDCFQGVDNAGGICYFLWERDYIGDCQFTTKIKDTSHSIMRKLNEYPMFIRDVFGLKIIKKVEQYIANNKTLSDSVSPQTPFGIVTSYTPQESGTPCHFTCKIGKKFVNTNDIRDNYKLLNKYKVLVPKAPIAGQTDFTKPVGLYHDGNVLIALPGECCTQTWLVAYACDTLEEAKSFKSYLLTKIVRFLILQTVVSQDVSRKNFSFVPLLNKYTKTYTDETLLEEWQINNEEWSYIDSKIHNYEMSRNNN